MATVEPCERQVTPSPARISVLLVSAGRHVSVEHVSRHGPADALVTGASQLTFELSILGGPLNWTSGTVASSNQTYLTTPSELQLAAGSVYHWRVRVSMSPQQTLTPFCTASFETAPAASLFPGTSQWIGGGAQLRSVNGIDLPQGPTVEFARVYASGVGAFYLYINGQRVGDHVMDPPQSVYSKTIYYETFDIQQYLRVGRNDFGALLGTCRPQPWCRPVLFAVGTSSRQRWHRPQVTTSGVTLTCGAT